MTVTISVVAASDPASLSDAATQLRPKVTELDAIITTQRQTLSNLADAWEGAAAGAAQARGAEMVRDSEGLRTRLQNVQATLRFGGTNLSALRTEILNVYKQVVALGGNISDNGTVRSSGAAGHMTPTLAGAYTTVLQTLLQKFSAVDEDTANAIKKASAESDDGHRASNLRDDLPASPPKLDGELPKEPFKWTDEDLYEGEPSGADVNQDAIGDCYLMATMAALAHADPQRIKDRIRFNPDTGEFDVTLWDGKDWRHIPVTQADIDANIAQHGGSGVDIKGSSGVNRNAALWPAVLESAYAKMKYPGQDLKSIESGLTPYAMEALTGNEGTYAIPAVEWFTTQHIDNQITEALANHQPVVFSTSLNAGGPVESTHVYSVEAISGTGSDAMVTLRNPWGADGGDATFQVRLGDLVGKNPLDGVGLGTPGMFNFGNM